MFKTVSNKIGFTLLLILGSGAEAIAQPINQTQPLIIYVNPSGSDRQGKGTIQAPLRSLTAALEFAKPKTIIQLAPGTYSAANGEIFPIKLKSGVIVRGNEPKKGTDTVIFGGGNFLSPTATGQNIAILGADRAELRGVKVTNKNPRGYGLWLEASSPVVINNTFTGSVQDGILVTGDSRALISKNVFIVNGANGMSIEGAAQPEISNNLFQNTGFGLIIRQNAAPRIFSNVLSNNRVAIIVQPTSIPVLRGNIIEKNLQAGLVILANGLPDLGNAASPGGNIFRNNGQRDIQYTGQNPIAAVGNQVSPQKVSGNLILTGQFTAVAPIGTNSTISSNAQTESNSISIVIRRTVSETADPLPVNIEINRNLPPVKLAPPQGATVNQPIAIASSSKPINISLRYRVIVPVVSEESKIEIRRLVPNAFPSVSKSNGQSVIQVGAFSDRTLADEQVKKLAQSGFNAAIESINQ
jgi:parallel beta-helix repeat protein